jgi:hypothetical protein
MQLGLACTGLASIVARNHVRSETRPRTACAAICSLCWRPDLQNTPGPYHDPIAHRQSFSWSCVTIAGTEPALQMTQLNACPPEVLVSARRLVQ